jgi:putative salt-induced outer membrane protein YdiY
MTKTFALALAFAGALSASANAQAPVPRSWGGTVDLGYVDASGNTSTRTFSLGENLKWKTSPRFAILQQFRSIYGEARDSVIANLIDTDINGDYRLFDHIGLTMGVGYDRNKFAGIRGRTEETIGASWSGSTTRGDSLRVIGGILWTQQENTLREKTDFTAAKAGLMLRSPVGKYAYFVENIEAIPNFDTHEDWRMNSETALVAAFSSKLALKLTYIIRYDNLPEPTFMDTDRLFTAGLQIKY